MIGCFTPEPKVALVSQANIYDRPSTSLGVDALKAPIIGIEHLLWVALRSMSNNSDYGFGSYSADRSSPGATAPTNILSNGRTPFITSGCLLTLVNQRRARSNLVCDEHLLCLGKNGQAWQRQFCGPLTHVSINRSFFAPREHNSASLSADFTRYHWRAFIYSCIMLNLFAMKLLDRM